MPPIIQLENIHKAYYLSNGTRIPVLNGVSLTIKQGEFVALMGHSGSGKSTLLNILWFLHTADTGSYLLKGEDISQYKDDTASSYIRNKIFGFIFQLYFLIPRLDALHNVMLPALYAWKDSQEAKEKAIHYLKQVGLSDKMTNKPSELSGWQQQRVAIARALMNAPDIILADEPTGALDATTSKEVMELISSFHTQGKTIIMVTHEPDIARYAQRIIYLKDGVVESEDWKIA